jgi:16S rRNA G1207 methylase RsmC
MSARLLEHNNLHILSGQPKLGFLGIGDRAEANRKAANLAEVKAKYPMPPKGCGEAQMKIAALKSEIEAQQKIIATQGDSRVARRWIEAYTQVMEDFNKWVITANCEQQQSQAKDTAYWDQVNTALNKEKTDVSSKATVDNWVIYGVLAALGIGALFIILKK